MQNELLPDSFNATNKNEGVTPFFALHDQQLLFNTLMQSPAFICILKGIELNIIFGNYSITKVFGERFKEGKTIAEALPELEGEGIIEIIRNVFISNQQFAAKEMPLHFIIGDEPKLAYLNFNCEPYGNERVQVAGVSVFAYDVSEQVIARNAIKASENKFRKLIYSLPTALYTCDAEGKIILYNTEAVKLLGEEPAIGKKVGSGTWKMCNADGTPLPVNEYPVMLALKEEKITHHELIIKRADGTHSHVIPYPQAIYDSAGKVTGAINNFVDITEQVNTRRQLEQTANMIRDLYMNAPAFICTLKGREFVYELVNPEYQKLYGKRKLVGLKLMDALPEIRNTEIPDLLTRVYETGEPFVGTQMRFLLARDEGKEPEETYLNFSYQPMYNLENEIDGILVFGYEVTNQVLAKNKSEENLRWVLESLPQITSASSSDGTNIFFNKFFFEYSGLGVEEATKNGWNSIVHPEELENVLREWESCKREGKEYCMEIRLRRNVDRMYRWHIAHITPMKDHNGMVTQWIASATDIHEQKIKEQQKDDFMSIASHEMKTPLTTIKAYLQLLEMTIESKDAEALLYTRKAIASVERLKDLISELLDVSKIQHGQLNFNFSNFDFNEMVSTAVEEIEYNSPHHKIYKTGSIEQPVYGDRERLRQVIVNLLSNAVKYSPDANEVYISVNQQPGEIIVAVKDSGIGIAAVNLSRIFERYFRIDGQELHFQGLGIGLYISMKIIERHRGKIRVESEPGKGSTFYVYLPN